MQKTRIDGHLFMARCKIAILSFFLTVGIFLFLAENASAQDNSYRPFVNSSQQLTSAADRKILFAVGMLSAVEKLQLADERTRRFKDFWRSRNIAEPVENLGDMFLYTFYFKNYGEEYPAKLLLINNQRRDTALLHLYNILQDFSVALHPGKSLLISFVANGKPHSVSASGHYAYSTRRADNKNDTPEWRFPFIPSEHTLWLPDDFFSLSMTVSKEEDPETLPKEIQELWEKRFKR